MLARAALKDFERAAIDSVAAFYKNLPLLQRYVQTVKGFALFFKRPQHILICTAIIMMCTDAATEHKRGGFKLRKS